MGIGIKLFTQERRMYFSIQSLNDFKHCKTVGMEIPYFIAVTGIYCSHFSVQPLPVQVIRKHLRRGT